MTREQSEPHHMNEDNKRERTMPTKTKLPKKKPLPVAPLPETPEDSLRALRLMVREYNDLVDQSVRSKLRAGDKRDKETGEVMVNPLPQEDRDRLLDRAERYRKDADSVMRRTTKLLHRFPIYTLFLQHVDGCGPVTAAKLIADVNIAKCNKVSSLHQFCGLGVMTGDDGDTFAQCAKKGETRSFNLQLKTAILMFVESLIKNPRRDSSPYYQRLAGYKHRMQSSPRFVEDLTKKGEDGKPPATFDGVAGGRAHVHSMAKRVAAQLFLEDRYLVWRAIEGLPVWPSYQAAKLGHIHAGKVRVTDAEVITVDRALEIVGMSQAAAAE